MKVLVVSQYYPPEIGATQNRMHAFVTGLHRQGHAVSVICEQPNHPGGVFQSGYGMRPLVRNDEAGVKVTRLWVATSPRKTTPRRLAFYGTFAAGTLAAVLATPRPDVVFATSPPLPGALAAGIGARRRRIPFVLDVRDLWPAAAEALGEVTSKPVLRRLERCEAWLYRHAHTVTATTEPFCRHIDRIAGRRASVFLPNGALDELLRRPARPPALHDSEFILGFVGNLGIAQGLSIVLDAAQHLIDAPVRFKLVGDGPVLDHLRVEAASRNLTNVEFQPAVAVDDVARVLEGCTALLVPLRTHSVLADFIPSKLYDAMAVGRPTIVAARGEAAELVTEAGCGIVVPPEDGRALAEAITTLRVDQRLLEQMGSAGRAAARQHARSKQLARLLDVLGRAAAAPDRSSVPEELEWAEPPGLSGADEL